MPSIPSENVCLRVDSHDQFREENDLIPKNILNERMKYLIVLKLLRLYSTSHSHFDLVTQAWVNAELNCSY